MNRYVKTEKIEEYIKENNLTKREFCKLCKISPSTLNKILKTENFNLLSLFKITRVMNINFCDIFNNIILHKEKE